MSDMTQKQSGGQVHTHQVLIDAKETARRYGINWRTLLRWADLGLVPWGIKIGGARRWNAAEVDAHIAAGCPKCHKPGDKQ
jgi:predicted DNA-binding transcriptional regulator AlpA